MRLAPSIVLAQLPFLPQAENAAASSSCDGPLRPALLRSVASVAKRCQPWLPHDLFLRAAVAHRCEQRSLLFIQWLTAFSAFAQLYLQLQWLSVFPPNFFPAAHAALGLQQAVCLSLPVIHCHCHFLACHILSFVYFPFSFTSHSCHCSLLLSSCSCSPLLCPLHIKVISTKLQHTYFAVVGPALVLPHISRLELLL